MYSRESPNIAIKRGLCLVGYIAAILLAIICIDRVISLDKIRHLFSDKIHPVTIDDIIEELGFSFERSKLEKEEVDILLSQEKTGLDLDSRYVLDSLMLAYDDSWDFSTCLELYRFALNNEFSESIQSYYLTTSLDLAETKYDVIWPIIYNSVYYRDVDGLLSIYDLIREWKWDRDYLHGDKNDKHDFNYNYAIRTCLKYSIMILEDSYYPVDDNTASLILKLSNVGLRASNRLSHGSKFNPLSQYFASKRAEYAYLLDDARADKYADYLISNNKRNYQIDEGLYLERNLGGNDPSFFYGFLKDPLFLRYKSCLKHNKYKKAKSILKIVQANYTYHNQDPIHPYYDFSDSLQYSNKYLGDIALPYSVYILASMSENARLGFLTEEDDYDKWLTGAFVTGAWYLSPTEGFLNNTIDCLFDEGAIPTNKISSYIAVNYNNSDPRWVYNTALYIKGATTKISGAIEKAIIASNNKHMIEELKALHREHVFSSELDTEGPRYTELNDSVEELLGPCMKETLSDCFYSFADIKNGLSDNECAIEIVKVPSLSFGEDSYKAVVLRNDWEEPKTITLANSGEVNESIISGNYYSDVSYLYYSIWKPLEKYITPQDVIYLAPDGVLSLISFSSLVNDRGQHLSDIYDIRTCVSTKSVMDKHEGEHQESIALFGGMNYDGSTSERVSSLSGLTAYRSTNTTYRDRAFTYLAGSEREVEVIKHEADKCQMPSLLYVGEGGSEYNFKDLTGKDISIIHVATHGFYYNAPSTRDLTFFEKISVEDNPLNRCGLIFSGGNKAWKGESIPDNQEDGILLGSEIARMDLSGTDLVVLSACNTGLGDISEEGIEGLQMAFKKAGVQSLLMTLAKVDDEATSYFMTTFYENLFSGKDKHTSFKEAVNTMRSSKRFSDPKYWSPFILID